MVFHLGLEGTENPIYMFEPNKFIFKKFYKFNQEITKYSIMVWEEIMK